MTSDELIALLLSDEGLRYTDEQLKLYPNYQSFNVHRLYSGLVSILRSFNEDIKAQPEFSLIDAIDQKTPISMTTCVCKDDIDFIVSALDVMFVQGDSTAQLIIKGLTTGDTTPFETYSFAKMPDGINYFLTASSQYNFKILYGKVFSPWGCHVFSIPAEGNGMINSKARYPRFEGIRGECKQQCIPISVYVDKRGKEDEFAQSPYSSTT